MWNMSYCESVIHHKRESILWENCEGLCGSATRLCVFWWKFSYWIFRRAKKRGPSVFEGLLLKVQSHVASCLQSFQLSTSGSISSSSWWSEKREWRCAPHCRLILMAFAKGFHLSTTWHSPWISNSLTNSLSNSGVVQKIWARNLDRKRGWDFQNDSEMQSIDIWWEHSDMDDPKVTPPWTHSRREKLWLSLSFQN